MYSKKNSLFRAPFVLPPPVIQASHRRVPECFVKEDGPTRIDAGGEDVPLGSVDYDVCPGLPGGPE